MWVDRCSCRSESVEHRSPHAAALKKAVQLCRSTPSGVVPVWRFIMQMIRLCERSKSGYNNGDLETAFVILRCGQVADGFLPSKDSRNHFTANDYAVYYDGYTSLTGKGVWAFLTSWAGLSLLYRHWRRYKSNPFIASPREIANVRD